MEKWKSGKNENFCKKWKFEKNENLKKMKIWKKWKFEKNENLKKMKIWKNLGRNSKSEILGTKFVKIVLLKNENEK